MRTKLLLFGICLLALGCCACNAGEVSAIDQLITVVGGITAIVAAAGEIVAPSVATAIAAGNTLIQNGLKALINLVNGYKAGTTPLQDVTAAFSDLQTNLQSVLAAAKISDPATSAKVTAGITGVSQSLALIEANLAGSPPPANAATTTTTGS